ncbi:hypothetical protein EI94DRAFT_1629671 [Lactarius quietus]|nr:hypothetical protein EI94DRAFT_1629671 [Lactarius quietus]
MELYHVPFHPNNSHIRCLAHVVNLIAQKMLSVVKDVDNPELQDYYESLNKQFPVHYDIDNDDELQDFENDNDDRSKAQGDLSDGLIDQESGEQDHFGGMGAIEKVCLLHNTSKAQTAIYSNDQLRTAIVKIVGTPGQCQLFREKAKQYYSLTTRQSKKGVITQVAALMPVRDIRTRWNSTHTMIKHAQILRKLHGLLLSSREWDLLGQYEDLLECFTKVTAVISRSSMPTLPWVLPMYELMHEHLVTFMDDTEQPLAIHEAACTGHEKLMQYYKIARESMHVIVATVCHPTLRTDWFLKLGANGHTCALTVFKHVYEEYAANVTPPDDQPMASSGFDSDSDNGILGSAAAHPVIEQTRSSPELQSEFTRWVANEGGAGKMHYPLVWWKVFHCAWLVTSSKLTIPHIRLMQMSSQSFLKWHRTFSRSWGLQFR